MKHLAVFAIFAANASLIVGQFSTFSGSKETDFSLYFCIFLSILKPVYVFSRPSCSAVHIQWPWIRVSWSCPLTLWCCFWGKKMQCSTVLVCQQVWNPPQTISKVSLISINRVMFFFINKITLQLSYCFSPNERIKGTEAAGLHPLQTWWCRAKPLFPHRALQQ